MTPERRCVGSDWQETLTYLGTYVTGQGTDRFGEALAMCSTAPFLVPIVAAERFLGFH